MDQRASIDEVGAGKKRVRLGVIAPANHGSLGDQAMLEVVRARFSEDDDVSLATLLHRSWTAPLLRDRYRIKRFVATNNKAVTALQNRYISKIFSSVWVIGADNIDGAYNEEFIIRLLNMLKRVGSPALQTGIFGCSVSNDPKKATMSALAANPNLVFLARDPLSGDRFAQAAGRSAHGVADLAFMLAPELTTPTAHAAQDWIRRQKAANRRVMAVNSSGHTTAGQTEAAVKVQIDAYRHWLDGGADRSILFFPHDLRPSPIGDVEIISSLYGALRDEFPDRLWLLEPPINAWDVKALLGGVDSIVTGRMHAAIAALSNGVAPMCVVYQGKFEGLMQHFQLEGLCHSRDILSDGSAFRDALDGYDKSLNEKNDQAAARLPSVLALAEKNFDFIQ